MHYYIKVSGRNFRRFGADRKTLKRPKLGRGLGKEY